MWNPLEIALSCRRLEKCDRCCCGAPAISCTLVLNAVRSKQLVLNSIVYTVIHLVCASYKIIINDYDTTYLYNNKGLVSVS